MAAVTAWVLGLVALSAWPVEGSSRRGKSDPEAPRWVAAGGGATPETNQLALEADLALAAQVLGPGGKLLFAGGPGSHGVQVHGRDKPGDPLLAELALIFSPRQGRDATYRKTTLAVDGPATHTAVLSTLEDAVKHSRGPLTFYFAAHGDKGSEPREAAVLFWGGWALSATDLADLLDSRDGNAGPVRLVMTSCHAGGFAELAFKGAQEAAGAAPASHCGFFATTWERASTGCDPNPDRRAHDGYGVYFLNALRRRDRTGSPLRPEQIDFDGDGQISLREAHSRARIAAPTVDVPTTTSERWLLAVAHSRGARRAVRLPEEDAVIAALGQALGVSANPSVLRRRLDQMRARLDEAEARLEELMQTDEELYTAAAASLLARWPVVDDPWHPDFARTLQDHGDEIRTFLASSPEHAALRRQAPQVREASDRVETLREEQAPLERLLRALDYRSRAELLHAAGGPQWKHFLRLLECERGTP